LISHAPLRLQLGLSTSIIVDLFAGGGGASTGIEAATGHPVKVAINHDAEAVSMHAINHPYTIHYCEDVREIKPGAVEPGSPISLLWASPDCKHFSKAKGGKPVSKRVRGLAWVIVQWAAARKPGIITLENVEEFVTWGPLLKDGRPCPKRKGKTFNQFVGHLRNLGYKVEWKELRACDYGAPTIRKRFFLIARRDGQAIVWPKATHGKKGSGLEAYRTAADIIDWSIPCPSIFERSRPLAENTMRRIARGIQRYVVNNPTPFIVKVNHAGSDFRGQGIDEPLQTITSKHGYAVVEPFIAGVGGRMGQSPERSVNSPVQTVTAKADSVLIAPVIEIHHGQSTCRRAEEPLGAVLGKEKHALVGATLIQTGYGERQGQAPRVPGIDKPLGTVVAGGGKHALVSAFLAKHYGGVVGTPVDVPTGTITTADHHSLVTAHIMKMRGENVGHGMEEPLHTVTAGGFHHAEVRAFLIKYFGTDQDPRLEEPLHTVTTKDRFGLVVVQGVEYQIVDIGMRMLSPRELYRAQGFPDSYIIDRTKDGKQLSKASQVRMCGNSVSPVLAEVLVRANLSESVLFETPANDNRKESAAA
jgi:DNA (cytosine-5)-methyltransferase 1